MGTAGFDQADALLLRRTVDVQGKSRAWINGSPATATQLRELGDSLLDIHGQHAWQSLTRPDSVRGLLDAYASIDVAPLGQHWATWRNARKALHGHNEAFLCSNYGQRSRGSHGTWTYAFDKAHKIGAIHSAGRQG